MVAFFVPHAMNVKIAKMLDAKMVFLLNMA
jgi:hypothetical protein